MTQEQINGHLSMKKKYQNYPKLPKTLLKDPKTKVDGHLLSCLRGFNQRVVNWEKSHEIRLLNNI